MSKMCHEGSLPVCAFCSLADSRMYYYYVQTLLPVKYTSWHILLTMVNKSVPPTGIDRHDRIGVCGRLLPTQKAVKCSCKHNSLTDLPSPHIHVQFHGLGAKKLSTKVLLDVPMAWASPLPILRHHLHDADTIACRSLRTQAMRQHEHLSPVRGHLGF